MGERASRAQGGLGRGGRVVCTRGCSMQRPCTAHTRLGVANTDAAAASTPDARQRERRLLHTVACHGAAAHLLCAVHLQQRGAELLDVKGARHLEQRARFGQLVLLLQVLAAMARGRGCGVANRCRRRLLRADGGGGLGRSGVERRPRQGEVSVAAAARQAWLVLVARGRGSPGGWGASKVCTVHRGQVAAATPLPPWAAPGQRLRPRNTKGGHLPGGAPQPGRPCCP